MRKAVALLVLVLATGAHAQSIYKCKGADGRVTYSNQPCAGDGEALSKSGVAKGAPAPAANAPAPAGAKQCDNGPLLKPVVAKLDSPTTPDDVRTFLADERFRLVRCEYLRFTPEQRRERDAAMADVDSKDPARRKAAMARILALYERSSPAPATR